MAEVAYELPSEMITNDTQEVFPAETVAVFIHGVKITTRLKQTIINACHSLPLEEYIINKHNLNLYDMDHINWKGLKCFMSKFKMHQRAVAAKFIHGWLPTQDFLHKQRRSPSPYCPVCIDLFLPETTKHLLQCQTTAAIKERTTRLNQCLKALRIHSHTSPIILQCFEECLQQELKLQTMANKQNYQ